MLTLDALTKSYDPFRMGPLDLSVGREVVAVLGPSGCGKTTLLSVVAGLVEPDGGSVVLDGIPLHDVPLEARGTACVFQDNAVFPHLTARENVAYAAADPSLVTELAAALEITGVLDQRAGTLSGGERRRVEVARALAARPRALLLDEPTTGLDAPIKRRLRLQLRDLLQTLDIPVLYVTHDQDEAAAVADRIAVMDDGVVHQVGRPEAIFHRPASPFVATFTGNPNVFAARVVARNGTDAPRDDAPRTPLDWSGRRLHASRNGFAPDAAVWLCIRPEEIHLEPLSAPSSDAPDANTFDASITRRSYEGGLHVLTLRLDDEGPVVEARMLHSAARQIDLDARERIRLRLPEDAVHLMQRDADV